MERTSKSIVITVAVILAVFLTSSAWAQTTLCCFNNWRYSGTCIVQIAPDQQCGDVLGVLNNPMSTTTTYCGSTQIRGGWTAINCGGGGGTGSSSSSGGGTITQPEYTTPVEPSYTGTAQQPKSVTPEETTSMQDPAQAVQPTFVQPVQPTTAPEAKGPSVITL